MAANLIQELPHPQRLALSYAKVETRRKTLALFALDARLSAVLKTKREPMLAQLRLAWWRDNLAKPADSWPRGDEVLEALRSWSAPAALVPLVSAWEALLAEELTPETITSYTEGRAVAFRCLARELGAVDPEAAGELARVFALADLASNLRDAKERELVIDHGRAFPASYRLPRSLRPLAVLAGLGKYALQRGGQPLLTGPGSVFLALRIGLTGR